MTFIEGSSYIISVIMDRYMSECVYPGTSGGNMFASPYGSQHSNHYYVIRQTAQTRKLSHMATNVTYKTYPDIGAKAERVSNGRSWL